MFLCSQLFSTCGCGKGKLCHCFPHPWNILGFILPAAGDSHRMTPEKPRRALWEGHGLETRPQFHEETQREKKERHLRRKRGKTREVLGPPPFGAPTPWCLHPSSTHPSCPPTLRAHTFSGFGASHPSRSHFFWVWGLPPFSVPLFFAFGPSFFFSCVFWPLLRSYPSPNQKGCLIEQALGPGGPPPQ